MTAPKICPICDAGDPTNVIHTCEHMAKAPAATPPKFKNPHRLTVRETLANEGMTLEEFVEDGAATDSVVPACCDEGCQVEPDGRCEHGCPSVLLALGVI